MVKYRGLISWTTGDINTPLPPTAETEGSFLQIKQLNYSIPRLTCHVQKGMIKWTEEFKLQILKNHEERGHKKHRGIPSALKAYACDSEKSEPLAEFSLGMVEECRLEDFQSYTVEPSTQSVLLHRKRVQEVSVPHCSMKISSNYARCYKGRVEGFTNIYTGAFYLNASQCEGIHETGTLGLDLGADQHIIRGLDSYQPYHEQIISPRIKAEHNDSGLYPG